MKGRPELSFLLGMFMINNPPAMQQDSTQRLVHANKA